MTVKVLNAQGACESLTMKKKLLSLIGGWCLASRCQANLVSILSSSKYLLPGARPGSGRTCYRQSYARRQFARKYALVPLSGPLWSHQHANEYCLHTWVMVRYGGVSPSYKFVPNSLSFPLNVYDKLIFWVHIDFTICAYIVTLTPSFSTSAIHLYHTLLVTSVVDFFFLNTVAMWSSKSIFPKIPRICETLAISATRTCHIWL